jgi:hypothetical protein
MSEAAARALAAPHLWAGEEVLWCGQPVAVGPPVARAAARKGFYGSVATAVGAFIFVSFVRGSLHEADPATDTKLLIGSAVLAALVLAFGSISAWARARRLASIVAYAVTNRRIIMVQGEDPQWVGLRELEDVQLHGSDLVARRGRTDTEELWVNQGERRSELIKAEVVSREVTRAALGEPERVLALVQTLRQLTAS